MMRHNVVQLHDSAYTVVPLIRDFIRCLIDKHPGSNEAWNGHIQRVKDARSRVSQNSVAFALELLEATFKASFHAYESSYPEMYANKPYIQSALLKVTEDEALYKNASVLQKVLQILAYMVYNPLVFDREKIQDVCIRLAEIHSGDEVVVGRCMSAASAFYRYSTDERHGHDASLKRAEQAIALATDSEPDSIAKAVALRSKGLILRDLGKQRDVAILCHNDALCLLKPLPRSQVAQLEIILNLAEMSGTLDYEGRHAEGISAGKEAIDLADALFRGGDHPVTALAYGALGMNLRMSGNPQGAYDVHKRAYDIRFYVCGPNHQDTAVSVQQMGLCQWNLGQIPEAEENLKKSLEIREKLMLNNLIGNSLVNLAQLYLESDRMEEAVQYFKRTVDTRLTPGLMQRDHKKIQEPCQKLVEILEGMGRTEEATEYAKHLV